MDKYPKTAPACLTFALEPQTGEGASRRFRGVAYSGGVIPQYGWYGDACIDLSTISLPSGKLFALVDHDPSQRAGQFSARIENNALIVEGELFQSSAAGREVAELLAEGAPWQMSVGIQAETESSDQKRAVLINGQTFEVNTVFRHAALREVSFVPVGADPNTAVAAFSRNMAGAVSPDPIPQTTEGDTSMTLEALQAKVAELTQQLEAANAKTSEATTQLAEMKAAARTDAILKLGREFSPEQKAALEKLGDAEFLILSAVIAEEHKTAPDAPPHLFSEQFGNGKPDATHQKPALASLNATLINQLSGKKE